MQKKAVLNGKASQRRISTIKISTNMSGNHSLLTVLFIMCYFIKKGGNYAVTTITRERIDYFTDVCQNCHSYGANPQQGICKCGPQYSVFLPDQSDCKNEQDLMTAEYCQIWKNSFVEVIDTEGTNRSYLFIKGAMYSSYQLEPLISYRNSTTGEWQFFNLSGNVLMLQNGSDSSRFLQIKVTEVSPNLTQFKGYVMKLGLKRITRDGKTEKSCLLFKAKGKIHFPLNCIPTTTPGPGSSTTTDIPTSTTSSTPTLTTTFTPTTTGRITTKQHEIIVAIATGGTALVLMFLICTVLVVYRYTYMCRPRGLQARNLGHDFDVIRNPGPQTYRIQEEPVYDEVSNIFPCGKGSACSPAKEWEESATVLLNPNLYEARFSIQRQTRERLPSGPEIAGNTNTQVDVGAIGEGAEDSIVLKNPKVVETSSSSLPRSENDVTKLPEAHELEGQSVGDHQYHVEDDVDNSTVYRKSEGTSNDHYQRLEQGKRPHSVFICPSCSDNPVYQRPTMPHSCPHGAKDKLEENRASFYESLRGRELGLGESVYVRPSQSTEELAAEDKENRNSEEGEVQPEYHTLEQEEAAVSKEDLAEPGYHDYNVLEGPGETGDEVDERAKDSISRDPDQTSEDSGLSLEPSKIFNMEDNPAYAKPWKAKEDPELPLEPSDVLNIEHNPLYSTPWKTKMEEPCLKRRAYSL